MPTITIGRGITLGNGISIGAWTTEASGGTITTSSGYRIHTFTSNSTFQIPSSGINAIDILVVGAGGGSIGYLVNGAGGGGGVVYKSSILLPRSGLYTVTIGQGRAGANGDNTLISGPEFSLIGYGGGLGGVGAAGRNGGSGGGGGGGASYFSGGITLQPSSASGGYGSNGQAGTANTSGNGGGASGTINGIGISMTPGITLYYGPGGGGGTVGAGPNFGGLGQYSPWGQSEGAPGDFGPASPPQNGQTNTGGGGGGYGNNGSTYGTTSGGSGIVIIRYLI